MPGKLYKNSTGLLKAEFVTEELDEGGELVVTPLITATLCTVTVVLGGVTVVAAAAMDYDEDEWLRQGWPRRGCWVYTIAHTALTGEGTAEVTYIYDGAAGHAETVEQIPVVENTGRN